MLRRRDLFSETYCGGYSGEDPPLPIPNREVKLTIADGTAPPGGRVGSCHALTKSFETKVSELFLCVSACLNPLGLTSSNALIYREICILLAANGEQGECVSG